MYTFCKAISIYTNSEDMFPIRIILLILMLFCYYSIISMFMLLNIDRCHTFWTDVENNYSRTRFKGLKLNCIMSMHLALYVLLGLLILEIHVVVLKTWIVPLLGQDYYLTVLPVLLYTLGVLPARLHTLHLRKLLKAHKLVFDKGANTYAIREKK